MPSSPPRLVSIRPVWGMSSWLVQWRSATSYQGCWKNCRSSGFTIINEPAAAAISTRINVYDLGGSTFDVSVFKLEDSYDFSEPLTRAKFEGLNMDLFRKTMKSQIPEQIGCKKWPDEGSRCSVSSTVLRSKAAFFIAYLTLSTPKIRFWNNIILILLINIVYIVYTTRVHFEHNVRLSFLSTFLHYTILPSLCHNLCVVSVISANRWSLPLMHQSESDGTCSSWWEI